MGAKSKVKRREKGEARTEPPAQFERELSDFLAWVQLEKGLSKNTVASYENDLVQCALHLKGQGVASWGDVELGVGQVLHASPRQALVSYPDT